MKVVIPVAGAGTRLRPHTLTTPKPLLPVAGKPIIDHIIESINSLNFSELILVTGPDNGEIFHHVKLTWQDKFNVSRAFQEEKLGLGHAIFQARGFFKKGEDIFIILGDTIIEGNFEDFVDKRKDFLAVKKVDDPSNYGIVELDKDGKIVSLEEKPQHPKSNLAIVGVYYISDATKLFEAIQYIIANDIKTKNEYQITDALKRMVKSGWIFYTKEISNWYDCGRVSEILKTNRFLLQKNGSSVDSSVKIENSVIIDPVFIDKGVSIKNSIVGPYVHISEGVTLTNVMVKNSIVLENATVEESQFEMSIVGKRAKVRTASLKLNIGDYSELDMGR